MAYEDDTGPARYFYIVEPLSEQNSWRSLCSRSLGTASVHVGNCRQKKMSTNIAILRVYFKILY